MSFLKVGTVAEFPEGVVRRFAVYGADVAVVAWRGRLYAFDDHCTHQGLSLTTGVVSEEAAIFCAHHWAAFDLATGHVLDGPALEALPVFAVRLRGDDVFVGSD